MNQIEVLSRWFSSQEGVGEDPPGSNSVIYNDIYYGSRVSGPDYPWCAAFIWVGFYECGLSELYLNGIKSAYCPYILSFARERGQLVTEGYKEGDLLLYSFDGSGRAEHIGYCLKSEGDMLLALEGNAGDKVKRLYRSKKDVIGAYRPPYSEEIPESEPPTKAESAEFKPGELVKIKAGAKYYTGAPVPNWVLRRSWYIEAVKGDRIVINRDLKGEYQIMSPIPASELIGQAAATDIANGEYEVKKGDSLWKIAKQQLGSGLRYKELMTENKLKSSLIYPGMKLKIPEGEKNEK